MLARCDVAESAPCRGLFSCFQNWRATCKRYPLLCFPVKITEFVWKSSAFNNCRVCVCILIVWMILINPCNSKGGGDFRIFSGYSCNSLYFFFFFFLLYLLMFQICLDKKKFKQLHNYVFSFPTLFHNLKLTESGRIINKQANKVL